MPPHEQHSLPPDVIAAAQSGHKIDAIKLLREHTGMGLREAKEAVEALDVGASRRLGDAGNSGPGRAVKFVLLGLAVLLGLYFLIPATR